MSSTELSIASRAVRFGYSPFPDTLPQASSLPLYRTPGPVHNHPPVPTRAGVPPAPATRQQPAPVARCIGHPGFQHPSSVGKHQRQEFTPLRVPPNANARTTKARPATPDSTPGPPKMEQEGGASFHPPGGFNAQTSPKSRRSPESQKPVTSRRASRCGFAATTRPRRLASARTLTRHTGNPEVARSFAARTLVHRQHPGARLHRRGDRLTLPRAKITADGSHKRPVCH